jgi:hypothetical protein
MGNKEFNYVCVFVKVLVVNAHTAIAWQKWQCEKGKFKPGTNEYVYTYSILQ